VRGVKALTCGCVVWCTVPLRALRETPFDGYKKKGDKTSTWRGRRQLSFLELMISTGDGTHAHVIGYGRRWLSVMIVEIAISSLRNNNASCC
jgi:hypothetical protein